VSTASIPAVARSAGLALVLAASMPASTRAAAELASVNIHHVRAEPSGRHTVWFSMLDAEGASIPTLERGAVSVEADDRPVTRLEVVPWRERFRDLILTVVVDPELLARDGPAVRRSLERLGEDLGPQSRLRLVVAGRVRPTAESSAGGAGALHGRLPSTVANEARIFDALHAEVRRAARRNPRTGAAVLLLTRGRDEGSRRGVVDVLAPATTGERLVPILVVLLEDRQSAPEGERLARLAVRTGGAARRVEDPQELAAAATSLAARSRGFHLLRFRVPGWNAKVASHRLAIAVELGGRRRRVEHEFATAEALGRPWWQGPSPWLWLLGAALAGGATAAALARRPLFHLVVERGSDEGCSYQVFAVPLSLGAASGNDLTLVEPRVSRNHAVLERRGSNVEIVDLNSENGTYVNGERVTRRRLAAGDRIRLGGAVELRFRGGRSE
jgi:FHA domain-containing protein